VAIGSLVASFGQTLVDHRWNGNVDTEGDQPRQPRFDSTEREAPESRRVEDEREGSLRIRSDHTFDCRNGVKSLLLQTRTESPPSSATEQTGRR